MTTLRDLARWPDRCHEEVTRRAQLEPCDKPAVAARYDEANSGDPYPVCARHARAPMVPLAHLLGLMVSREGVEREPCSICRTTNARKHDRSAHDRVSGFA